MKEKKVGALGALSILALYLVSMGFSAVTPAMATLAAHFEGKDVSWISTVPTLFTVIGTFIAGNVMGKKLKYRTMAIIAGILYVVGGCAPALFDNYSMTLVCRGILGLGLGFMSPLGGALIIGLYKGQKQASMLGYGTMCMNAGGIFLQMLGGSLAGIPEIGWKVVFLAHAFGLVGLVMAFFLPEPDAPAPEPGASSAVKEKIAPAAFVIALLLLIFNVVNYPVMMNVSVLFEQRSAGGPAAAALSLSLYTVAGVVAGLIFGKLFQIAARWCLAIGYFICALGALCVCIGQTNVVMTAGLILIGFGFSIIMPCCMAWVGIATPPSTVAAATSLLMALMNLGAFASSVWLTIFRKIFNDAVVAPIYAEIVILAVTGVVFIVYNPFKQK